MSASPNHAAGPDAIQGNASAEREELLALFLDDLLRQAKQGNLPEIDAVARAHPDIASELRELWATAMIAEDLIEFSDDNRQSSVGAPSVARPLNGLRNDESSTIDHRPSTIDHPIGDYEPLEEIGRGGMGVVYKARQNSLGRTVALKMLLRGTMSSSADVARFRAEAESAAKLRHPHIVPVYEVGEHEGQPYFSMQHVEGTTLARRIAEGPLPPREAAGLLLPICRAIGEAHRQGVLHRDLKPSNILIDEQRRPYVSDFGLAKQLRTSGKWGVESGEKESDGSAGPRFTIPHSSLATLTQTGAILGTPGYMAPEQAAGSRGEIGTATDVYSLGAILYAMLTGRAPFQAASPVDTVLLVLEQDPLPPRVLNPTADPDLELIALKCLQKPADLRYSSADALADDLEAFLANEPISARSSQFTQIISRAFRETHHAAVLENWGLLWMLHAAVLLALCLITNAMQLSQVESRWPYLALWIFGLSVWAAVFWELRRRSGPITFVERQIAHIWAGSMVVSTLLYAVEWILGLPVLALSPVLGLISGAVFLVKAGILTGAFYIQALALFATGVAMAFIQQQSEAGGLPNLAIGLFGVVSAATFFLPGLKYYRERRARKPSIVVPE